MNKQELENYTRTLVQFLEESEEKNPVVMGDTLYQLHRYESTLNRLSTIYCERNLTQSEEKKDENTQKKVETIAAELGLKVRFNSDPRGYAIRFVLPSGRYNQFDGETWALNW
jgi:choline kinase